MSGLEPGDPGIYPQTFVSKGGFEWRSRALAMDPDRALALGLKNGLNYVTRLIGVRFPAHDFIGLVCPDGAIRGARWWHSFVVLEGMILAPEHRVGFSEDFLTALVEAERALLAQDAADRLGAPR